MRKRLSLVCLAAVLAACSGDDKCLYGSQCDLQDCTYTTLECDYYSPPENPTRAIVVNYLRMLDAGREWAGKLSLEFPGEDPISGQKIEGQDLLDRVMISGVGSGSLWPEVESGTCEITKGGDELDKPLEGKCGFKFVNGRFLTACFDCTLVSALPP